MPATASHIIFCLVLGCASARAQTGTADALQAIVRGEYQRAVEILRSLTEQSQPDPLAQFLLATMYDSGTGVRANSLMACGLYVAAARPPNPLESQARRLGETIREPLSGFVRGLCSTDTRIIGPGGSLVRGQNVTPVPDAPVLDRTQEPQTAAGVDAFMRGDYPLAASLLLPAANARITTPMRVGAAEFFMAALYESGAGVPADPVRACAMYERAASGSGPFSIPSLTLWRATRALLAPGQSDECVLSGNIGLAHGFQPVAFALEPGYSIAIDIRGATIHYKGTDTRVNADLALRDVRFLPIQYTQLATGSGRAAKRHFIEVFRWLPGRQDEWVLLWQLSEVVGNALVPVATEQLTKISGSQPPARLEAKLRDLVHLSVTPLGDVQVAIFGGDHPRTGVIDSDADRQAARAVADLRRTSNRPDDQRRFDVTRRPSFAYVAAEGCGDVSAQGWSADLAEAVSVHVDKNRLGLSEKPQTFDISRRKEISLVIHVYDRSLRGSPFCPGHFEKSGPSQLWTATRGRITVSILPAKPRLGGSPAATGRAAIRIEGAEFVSASGVRVRAPQPILLNAELRRPMGDM